MIKIYDLGGVTLSTATSSQVAKIYVDKLHELGLCDAYDTSNFTFGSAYISGTQSITFSDGKKAELFFYIPAKINNSYPDYISGLGRVLFVDEEKHFIMCSTKMPTFLSTKNNEIISYYIQAMCCDDVYNNNVTMLGNQNTNSFNHFNIPNVRIADDAVDNKFYLLPLFMVYENAIPKNLYFSPNKTYPVGTAMKDSAGNQYVSVAPRFFYHMNG